MRVKTSKGISIDCLPDAAVCTAHWRNLSPLEMNRCPLGHDECTPESCYYYEEYWWKAVERYRGKIYFPYEEEHEPCPHCGMEQEETDG